MLTKKHSRAEQALWRARFSKYSRRALRLAQSYTSELNSPWHAVVAMVVAAAAVAAILVAVVAISAAEERISAAAERVSAAEERISVVAERVSVVHMFAGSAALPWEFRAAISRTLEARIFAASATLA
jgi:inorganic triphosphatase YgiF